ncbi:efflux RND transporter periplasmic adaptor subunit [Thermobrachium celere]|uniref:efflux RND transporter periplasmic adaptor subunit n=1 Tax=Thermobrachium celere TaxID=53422 RepID=UPI001942F787|nr:efflux RND transporter periplasmic adaptor subunit [Thermobrachium celere]GFR34448.1 macrolide ABC transporter [Thermobrachium celere]
MRRKGIIITLIIIFIFGITIYSLKRSAQKPVEVKTQEVIKGDIVASFSTSGTVESKNKREYYALTTGKVLKVYVKESDRVKKGDILVEFEVQDMTNQLKTAKLQYENAKLQLENLKKQKENALNNLPQNQTTSIDDQIKMQQNQVEIARLNVESIKQTIAKQQRYLKAESDGVVTQINVKEGSQVPVQLPAIVVEDIYNLRVVVNINQYDVNRIKEGQEAEIKFLDNTLKGVVSSISKSATKTMSTAGTDTVVKTYVDVLEKSDVIKPNFDVDVEIKTAYKNSVLKVPNEAVIQEKDNRERVYIVENGVVKSVDVKIGLQNDFESEVISGLKEGDRVVLNPPATLKDGVKVVDKDVKR